MRTGGPLASSGLSDVVAPRAAAAASCREAPVLECHTMSSDRTSELTALFLCCPLAYARLKSAGCCASIRGAPFESVIRYTCRVKQRANYRMPSPRSERTTPLSASCDRMQSGSRMCQLHPSVNPQSAPVVNRQPWKSGPPATPDCLANTQPSPSIAPLSSSVWMRWPGGRTMQPSYDRSLNFLGRFVHPGGLNEPA